MSESTSKGRSKSKRTSESKSKSENILVGIAAGDTTEPLAGDNLKPVVGILMGSDSDWPVMRLAGEALGEFGVGWEARVLSAHRTPGDVAEYARGAAGRGLRVLIAGAGGAAHLAGAVAAWTVLPVIGVPIESGSLRGLDSLLSIVQMPPGVPVGSVGIGAGRNAGLLAVEILGVGDERLRGKYAEFKARLGEESRGKDGRLGG